MLMGYTVRTDACPGHRGTGRAGDGLGRNHRVGATTSPRKRAAIGRRVRGRLAHREGRGRLNRGDVGSVDDPRPANRVPDEDSRSVVVAGGREGRVPSGCGRQRGGEERVGLRGEDDSARCGGGVPGSVDEPTGSASEGFDPGNRVSESRKDSPLEDGDGPVARVSRDAGEGKRASSSHLRGRHRGR